MEFIEFLYENILYFFQEPGAWKMPVMWLIGGLLIFLAIKKSEMVQNKRISKQMPLVL